MIQFSHVTKIYKGGWTALEDAHFEVARGEFVLLTGASGAGKSTILRLLYMDESPDQGEVSLYFRDDMAYRSSQRLSAGRRQNIRRRLGVVFQDFKLLADRTVYENVALALRVADVEETRIRHRVFEVLNLVRLGPQARRFPHELSGGEQQRVAIARAMANEPYVVLADEPTGNLDPQSSHEILRIFQDIHAAGTAVLMATHDYPLIHELPYRRIRLEHGRVVEDIPYLQPGLQQPFFLAEQAAPQPFAAEQSPQALQEPDVPEGYWDSRDERYGNPPDNPGIPGY
jgi:cell division transport system ATP-binding protein